MSLTGHLRSKDPAYKIVFYPLEEKGQYCIGIKDDTNRHCERTISRAEAVALWRILDSTLFPGPTGPQG